MAGAVEVLQYAVTCPPGVTKAAPRYTDLDMPTRTVLAIRVRVPPGPNGYMGFAIGSTGTSVIPYGDGQFITASDEIFEETLADQIDSGSWQAIMFNTGIFPHTIYILFTVVLPDPPSDGSSVQPVTVSSAPVAGDAISSSTINTSTDAAVTV